MRKPRIGFVGVGAMGQCAHLRNYASIPECNVVAIAEIRPELGKRVANRYGVPRVYPDHAAMLAEEELDGIVASQPYSRHGVLLPELFEAGIPVFTEKPLTCSVAAGKKIIGALQGSSARHIVGYHKRSDPATMYARNLIAELKASRELGPMRYVRILMPAGDWIAGGFQDLMSSQETVPVLEHDALPSDMDEETQRSYDSFVNYYIHQVNLMRHLLGENYRPTHADPTGTLMVIESESGVPGTIEMSPYQTTIDWQEEALVAFEKGFVKLELPAPLVLNRPGKVTAFRDPGDGAVPTRVEPQMPWVHAMRQQALNFIDVLKGKDTPLCEAPEALDDLHVAVDYITLWKAAQAVE
ncbi:MAG: Gfo/Idh/MocA family oxidoreductase [Nitrospiraceae bacterium]|nr:Gfo/Idh/MocA family oxidoreductase [Nitrospiraceae bacterium]